MSIQIETVHTDTFSMNYFRFGKGEKTLVILPGLSVQSVMGAADAIAAAYQPCEEIFTTYVFDRRSELPSSYPVREMARDTAEAFRMLGLKNVCLFGASQGAVSGARKLEPPGKKQGQSRAVSGIRVRDLSAGSF